MSTIPFEPDYRNDRAIGPIEVGRGTYWGTTTSFVTFTPDERVVIGRYCSLADDAVIMTGGNHHTDTVSTWPFENFFDQRPNPTRTYRPGRNTILGSDVWVGWGAHILGGARLGHGAVVGARAVVSGDVPPYAIVAGCPAKIIRLRFAEPIIEKLLQIAWWEWPAQACFERREEFYRPVEAFVERYAS